MAARKPPSTASPPPDPVPPVAEPGLLDTALAPLRVPARLVRALDMATEALADVPPMRTEVVTIRKQSESLDELLPALESMKTSWREGSTACRRPWAHSRASRTTSTAP